jgi:hypothetical protein
MAMANVAALNGSGRQELGRFCPKHSRRIGDKCLVSAVGVRSFGDNTTSYTPLHTKVLVMLMRAFGLFLWGELPPRAAATSSSNSARA